MDFIDILKQFSSRAEKLLPQIKNEEQTKTSLIMPFFQAVFGYDIFNPDEFVPEFTADVGIKKGEKVDYAILFSGEPTILIEAKWCGEPLDKHDSQLFRYFGTTKARLGILTNGIVYKFYTDLNEQNKMDLTPFLELDLLNIKESLIPELKRFCKSNFNAKEIFDRASELKYSNEIKAYFAEQLNEPSDGFVRHILEGVYEGVKTQGVIEKFKPVVKSSLNSYINELMKDKITSALKKDNPTQPEEQTVNPQESINHEHDEFETTIEEMEAFAIVKAILRELCDVDRLTHQHTNDYMVVLFDNNSRKRICRFWFKKGKRRFSTPDENKKSVFHEIVTLNDIYKYSNFIKDVCKRYL